MKLESLEKDRTYHIYNRGINGENIFNDNENKRYFLKLLSKHLNGKVTLLAYCLMQNHYHLVIRLEVDEKEVTQAFSNLFNAYAKAFNKRFSRTGSLFEKHFKRIYIKDETYLRNIIIYTHRNPPNHEVADFREYEFSSYKSVLESNNEIISVSEVIKLFDDINNFKFMHTKDGFNLQGLEDLVGLHDNHDKDLQGSENLAGQNEDRSSLKNKFYRYIENLQDTITSKLEEVDGKAKFQEDLWKRPEGGGGRTRVIENGNVFEKGGVNISAVHGELPVAMQQYFGVKDANFFACGLSLVLHPKSPMVPTVHANWRYFEMYNKEGRLVDQWFGGGQDLTPYYLFEEDAIHFHSVCKTACDKYHPDFYPNFKKKCDEYFWNGHRNEARGIGGLFFDYCKKTEETSMQDWYDYVAEIGNSFLEAYVPIVERRKNLEYTPAHRVWQEIRRGG